MFDSKYTSALRRIPVAYLVAAMVLAPALIWDTRRESLDALTRHQGLANATTAGLLTNDVLPEFQELLDLAPGELTSTALLANQRRHQLDQRLRAALAGLPVLKVKLYTTSGVTVYSSERRQTGENKADNAGFLAARAGAITHQLVHKDEFNGFEHQRAELDLVSSYLPVRMPGRPEVAGVMEVYADVTDVLAQHRASAIRRAGVMIGALAVLLAVITLVSRRVQALAVTSEAARVRHARSVAELALRDELTGLLNRTAWKQLLARPGKATTGSAVAVLVIDLDRFKPVNDTHGHAAGDAVLREVAARMQRCLRDGDKLYRVGGDEFIAVLGLALYDVDVPRTISDRIVTAASRPVDVGNAMVAIGASVGIAVSAADSTSIAELVRHADDALYKAKADGRGIAVLAGARDFAPTTV